VAAQPLHWPQQAGSAVGSRTNIRLSHPASNTDNLPLRSRLHRVSSSKEHPQQYDCDHQPDDPADSTTLAETLKPLIHNSPKPDYGNLQKKSCFIVWVANVMAPKTPIKAQACGLRATKKL
jgi:hypothetical protein